MYVMVIFPEMRDFLNKENEVKNENTPDLSFSDSGDENYLWNDEIEYNSDF